MFVIENKKPSRVYKGVKIYRAVEEYPVLKEQKNGIIRELKPRYEIAYMWADSYPYNTIEECIEAIDRIYQKCIETGIDVKDFAKHFNN